MIAVIDYGMGNPGSICNMFGRIGEDARLVADPAELKQAHRIVLPGVGSYDHAVERLHGLGFWEPLHTEVLEQRKPLLGICLGMQLLCTGSEEGRLPGLGWIPGACRRFAFHGSEGNRKVPHMGWRTVQPTGRGSLLDGQCEEARFYFVHSYYVVCDQEADVAGTAEYGHSFHAAIHRDNIMGTQFHPEKSHRFGMNVMTRFAGFPS